MTQELMDAVDEQGEPAYEYGVILNYLFRQKDLWEIATVSADRISVTV